MGDESSGNAVLCVTRIWFAKGVAVASSCMGIPVCMELGVVFPIS